MKCNISNTRWVNVSDIYEYPEIQRIKLKDTMIEKLLVGDTRATKTLKYFHQFQSIGVIDTWKKSEEFLLQTIPKTNEKQCYLKVESPASANSFYINLTSNRKKTSTSINKQKWVDAKFVTVSGMCLFGGDSAKAITRSGRRFPLWDLKHPIDVQNEEVIDIKIKNEFTFYEKEKTRRISGFLNNLESRNSSPHRHIFIIPQVQYYFYLYPLYEAGLIDKKLFQKWIKEVDLRCERIKEMYQDNLKIKPIFIDSSLSVVEKDLISVIQSNETISQKKVFSKLSDSSHLWQLYLHNEKLKINSWNKLVFCSYIISFLEIENQLDGDEQFLHLDDQLEKVILRELARTLKVLGIHERETPFILGLYLLQGIVCDSYLEDSNAYTTNCFPDF